MLIRGGPCVPFFATPALADAERRRPRFGLQWSVRVSGDTIRIIIARKATRGEWQYFSAKAEQKGVDLSELPTDVLKRDIEINEALK